VHTVRVIAETPSFMFMHSGKVYKSLGFQRCNSPCIGLIDSRTGTKSMLRRFTKVISARGPAQDSSSRLCTGLGEVGSNFHSLVLDDASLINNHEAIV